MHIKYKQDRPENCGIYALANIFNDATFLEHKGTGDSEPCTHYEIDLLLTKMNKGFHLEVLYKDVNAKNIPHNWSVMPTVSSLYLPLFIVVSDEKDSLRHAIGVHVFKNELINQVDSMISILDSCRSESIETTWDNLINIYPLIHSVSCFESNDKSKGFIFLDFN